MVEVDFPLWFTLRKYELCLIYWQNYYYKNTVQSGTSLLCFFRPKRSSLFKLAKKHDKDCRTIFPIEIIRLLKNFIVVLTSLSNVKTKMEISSNFVVFLENLNFTGQPWGVRQLCKIEHGGICLVCIKSTVAPLLYCKLTGPIKI